MKTKKSTELTLKDKLSRLTLLQAAKLLGPEGHQLIRMGGKFEIVDFPGQALLSHDRFALRVPEAKVTISSQEETQESRELTGLFRSRLAECMEKDEQGRLKLTVTLPDSSPLDALAGSLARLLAREVTV